MVSTNDVSNLNGHFKRLYSDKIKDLVPQGVKLYNKIPFNSKKKLGDAFHCPVVLGLEHGFTYGGNAGSAFALNSAVAAVHENASIKGHEMVLRSYLSVGAVSRSLSSEGAFVQESKKIVENMLKSFVRRLEVQMLYGKKGLGSVSGAPAANVITILEAEWAPGIWAGSERMPIDVYESNGTFRHSCVIQSVSLDDRKITVDNDGPIADTDVIYYRGAKNNEFDGLHSIMEGGQGGSLFGITSSQYDLFKGSEIACGGADLSFALVEQGIARAMEKGLAEEDLTLLVNPLTWKNLLTEQDAKRRLDSSYSSSVSKAGSKEIEFHGQNGKVSIVSSIYCKRGFAYMCALSEFERIGSTDITFEQPGFDGKFLKLLEHANAYEMRAYTDQAVFTSQPGITVLFSGIVNS